MFHYHGDIVRKLFLLGGFIMAITLPFFFPVIPAPEYVSLLSIVVLGIAAGLTNPRHRWVSIMNTLISIGAVVVFEYHGVRAYEDFSSFDLFFWTNQVLALIFLAALYYSVKTLRGQLMAPAEKLSFEE